MRKRVVTILPCKGKWSENTLCPGEIDNLEDVLEEGQENNSKVVSETKYTSITSMLAYDFQTDSEQRVKRQAKGKESEMESVTNPVAFWDISFFSLKAV